MMARSTNAPFKGRIQKRKTNHLQIFTFGLQRTAGPYRGATSGTHAARQTAFLFDHLVGVDEALTYGESLSNETVDVDQCVGPVAVR